MTSTLCQLGCAEAGAAERAGALLARVIGATTVRKTDVPPAQLTGLLKQADHLIPTPPPP